MGENTQTSTSIGEMIAEHRAKTAAYRKERQRIEAQMSRLQAKLDRLEIPHHTDLAQMIGDAVAAKLWGVTARVLGPFGLTAEMGVHFNTEDGQTIASMTLRPWGDGDDATLKRVVEGSDNGRFPPNSVGRMNGMHQREVDLPEIDELVQDMRRQMAEREQKTKA